MVDLVIVLGVIDGPNVGNVLGLQKDFHLENYLAIVWGILMGKHLVKMLDKWMD